jgi:hypothetical protein
MLNERPDPLTCHPERRGQLERATVVGSDVASGNFLRLS